MMTGFVRKILTGAVALCFCTAFAAAQENGQVPTRDSEVPGERISCYNVRVLRVRDYRDSYVVTYQKQAGGQAQLVISKEWYRQNPQKLKFRKLTGVLNPFMSVYYTEGAFNHIKLTLPLSRLNPVWGWIATNNPNVPDPQPENFPDFQY
jgi:hypothetical protein